MLLSYVAVWYACIYVVRLCSTGHPTPVQIVVVSATLPAEVLEMTSKFMTDPVRVLVKRDELTLEVRMHVCFGSSRG